jgi:hypothetical protein
LSLSVVNKSDVTKCYLILYSVPVRLTELRQSESLSLVPFDKIEIFRLISFSDWEATNEAIEEQVARESYLQWLRDNERRNKSQMERSSTVTSGRFPSYPDFVTLSNNLFSVPSYASLISDFYFTSCSVYEKWTSDVNFRLS